MNPTILGVIGPGFLNQVPTLAGISLARLALKTLDMAGITVTSDDQLSPSLLNPTCCSVVATSAPLGHPAHMLG